jgi:hypothetical protein
MVNRQGVVALAFAPPMIYIPEYFPAELEQGRSPFLARRSRVVATGENIGRVVAAEETQTGKRVDVLRWGSESELRRRADGTWQSAEFNIHVAAASRSPLVLAAYQTVYDGAHETGRARQFLAEHGRHTHNRIRTDKSRSPESREGLESLGRLPEGPYATYLTREKAETILIGDAYAMPAVLAALREANDRYGKIRGNDRGVERDR